MSEKIEPALSAFQWQHRVRVEEETVIFSNAPENAGGPRPTWSALVHPGTAAVTVALANFALPDTDARKITREWIRTLRSEAKYVGSGGLQAEYEDEPYLTMAEREARLRAIADALESYLPPEATR